MVDEMLSEFPNVVSVNILVTIHSKMIKNLFILLRLVILQWLS